MVVLGEVGVFLVTEQGRDFAGISAQWEYHNALFLGLFADFGLPFLLHPPRLDTLGRKENGEKSAFRDALLDLLRNGIPNKDLPFIHPYSHAGLNEISRNALSQRLVVRAM